VSSDIFGLFNQTVVACSTYRCFLTVSFFIMKNTEIRSSAPPILQNYVTYKLLSLLHMLLPGLFPVSLVRTRHLAQCVPKVYSAHLVALD
jgi:hypothetical protein